MLKYNMDINKVRQGDILHLRLIAETDGRQDGTVTVKDSTGYCWCASAEDIVLVEQRQLKVGDIVRHHGPSSLWRIVAISNDRAWIERDGDYATTYLASLVRA